MDQIKICSQNLESVRKQEKLSIDPILQKISLENDMSKKIDLAIPFIQSSETPFHDVLGILKLFQHSEKDMRAVCEKLYVQKDIQQYLFKGFLSDKGKAEISSYYQYYIAKEVNCTIK